MTIDEPNEDYEQALLDVRARGNRLAEVEVLINLGKDCDWSKTRQKLEYYRSALAIAQEIEARSAQAKVLKYIGIYQQERKKFRSALMAFQQAFAIYQEIGDRIGQITLLDFLQHWHSRRGEIEQALIYSQQALAIARAEADDIVITNKLMTIASLYAQQQHMEQTQAAWQEALAIAKASGDSRRVASIFRRAGGIYELQGQLQQGLDCYQQALPWVLGTDEAIVLNRIADFYLHLGRLDEAIATYQAALSAFQRHEPEWEAVSLLRDIAYVYQLQGKVELAQQYEQQADAIDSPRN